jgi:uncharacterized protein YneF (UPF0154 family)
MKVIVSIFLMSILLVGFLVLGEYLTNKLPESKFGKWWRNHVIADGENYPD